MDISSRLRDVRKDKRLSQMEVAQKANIAVNSLRLYESGKRQPRMDQLQKIAAALDVSVSHLIGYETELQKIAETVEQVQRQYNDIVQPAQQQIEKALKPIQDQLKAAGLSTSKGTTDEKEKPSDNIVEGLSPDGIKLLELIQSLPPDKQKLALEIIKPLSE